MGIWTCPACGGDNPDGMRFCGHCGGSHWVSEGWVERGHSSGSAVAASYGLPVQETTAESAGPIPAAGR